MGTRHVSFEVKKRNASLFPGPEEGGALVTSFDDATRVETVEAGKNPMRRWLLYFAGKTIGGYADGYAGRRRAKVRGARRTTSAAAAAAATIICIFYIFFPSVCVCVCACVCVYVCLRD